MSIRFWRRSCTGGNIAVRSVRFRNKKFTSLVVKRAQVRVKVTVIFLGWDYFSLRYWKQWHLLTTAKSSGASTLLFSRSGLLEWPVWAKAKFTIQMFQANFEGQGVDFEHWAFHNMVSVIMLSVPMNRNPEFHDSASAIETQLAGVGLSGFLPFQTLIFMRSTFPKWQKWQKEPVYNAHRVGEVQKAAQYFCQVMLTGANPTFLPLLTKE